MSTDQDLKTIYEEQISHPSAGDAGEGGDRPGGFPKGLSVIAAVSVLCVVVFGAGYFIFQNFSGFNKCDSTVISEQGHASEAALAGLNQCEASNLVAMAQSEQFRAPNRSLLLLEIAYRKNNGTAARLIGEMYDPRFRGAARSPFREPDPVIAATWYRRAEKLNDSMARERLSRTDSP